jgi:hypothetical protein
MDNLLNSEHRGYGSVVAHSTINVEHASHSDDLLNSER